jgi:hypothetical protein
MTLSVVPLRRIAHGRAGDKGNTSNISLIACEPAWYATLLEQVTEEVVAQLFAARRPSRVRRFELPRLHALNFVLEDALDGGVNSSLNLDAHGKSLAFLLLGLTVRIPAHRAAMLNHPLGEDRDLAQ